MLAGAWALGLAPRVPPREDLDWLLLVLLPAAVVAEVAAERLKGWKQWPLRVLVAAATVPLLVHGSSYVTDLSGPGSREWSPGLTAAIYAGSAVALSLAW